MIKIEDLTVSFGEAVVLENLRLEIPRGECVLVTGPTGCGKSTLAHALTGLIPHAIHARVRGQVLVNGMRVADRTIAELATSVGIVFQNPGVQLFHLRVDEEVAFGLRNLGLDEAEVGRRVRWALGAVGLEHAASLQPAALSGGQKQRLAIACALAMRPTVLVLDEPTASLDVPGTHQLISTLQTLRRELGLTMVLIEHRLAEALRLADRVIILDQGRVEADGMPGAVLADRALLRRLGLRRPTEEPPVRWDRLLEPNGREPPDREPILSLERICAGYDDGEILHGIDMRLYPGEFVALVGDNGAGKSTLALIAAGLLKPRTGAVRFRGGGKPRGGSDVALLFQNPPDQLLTDSVEEEVALGPINLGTFHPGRHQRTLEQTDLADLRHRQPYTLSAGQQQRTALAACLAMRPGLVILDEPTLGQDWGHMEQLMAFLQRLNRQGTTVLLITHDFKLIHRYAERVILLKDGSIALEGRLRRAPERVGDGS